MKLVFCKFVIQFLNMDIQATKLEILKIILENENQEFIQKVAEFIQGEKKDFWPDLSTAQQEAIKEGIKELDNRERTSFDSFLDKIS
jgi:transcriptional regulator of heat shock response